MKVLRVILAAITGVFGVLLLTPVFLLTLPFWFVSIFTRAVSRLAEPSFLTRDQLIVFDPVFGWKSRPNLDTHHLMVDLFHLRTDADGWRGQASLEQAEVVVFGDSFAAGYGVSERQFFANLREAPQIKPIGIGGYCMVQELLWMQTLAPRLGGKLVVWFIYHANDLYDNLSPDLRGYRKPFVRERGQDGQWEIVSRHVTPERWPIVTKGRMEGEHHLPKLAELCSDTFLATRAYSACEYLIEAGKSVCAEAGADLVVMTIPESCQLTSKGREHLKTLGGDPKTFDSDLPDQQVEAACRRLDVGFLAGRTFLDASCYKTNDCHWNAKGHRKVSERLARLHHDHPSRSMAHQREASSTLVQT